jgi:hypothetical protein
MKFKEYLLLTEKVRGGVKPSYRKETFLIYENPTPDEISEIQSTERKIEREREQPDYETVKDLRAGIDSEGNLYVWSASVMHDNVMEKEHLEFLIYMVIYATNVAKPILEPDIATRQHKNIEFPRDMNKWKAIYIKHLNNAFPRGYEFDYTYMDKRTINSYFKTEDEL